MSLGFAKRIESARVANDSWLIQRLLPSFSSCRPARSMSRPSRDLLIGQEPFGSSARVQDDDALHLAPFEQAMRLGRLA